MFLSEKTIRWSAFFLLVAAIGTAHYLTASAGVPDEPPTWWWFFANAPRYLTISIFCDIFGLEQQEAVSMCWPWMGFVYYAVLLVPVFSAPFDRPRRDWILAIIFITMHFMLSGMVWMLEMGMLTDFFLKTAWMRKWF